MSAIDAVIVAAGRGTRAATVGGLPKQYVGLAGRPVLSRTLDVFLVHPRIRHVVVLIHPDDRGRYDSAVAASRAGWDANASARLLPPATGGATRQASVLSGLETIAAAAGVDDSCCGVLIHDAARPFVSHEVIDRVIEAIAPGTGAIAAVPLADTLKRVDSGVIVETVARDALWRAQTPQGFPLADILTHHRNAAAAGHAEFTDDAAIAEWAGLAVRAVEGSVENVKLTTSADIAAAERKLSGVVMTTNGIEVRHGTGFDVHKFAPGTSLWLCGVEIAHEATLLGHSDADVALHALTDAILGAISDGDIGQHFPPSDPQWKGAASDLFLADAGRRVRERGGSITNVDVTILCEVPKIGPHREAMRARIGEILGLEAGRIGVKATTTEGLGFTGRREGIAAMASATVTLPSRSLA